MFFPFTRFSGFVFQVSTTPIFSHVTCERWNRCAGQLPAFISDMDSPNCFSAFEGVGRRPTSTMEAKFEAMPTKRLAQFQVHFEALVSIPMFVQEFNRLENSILSLAQSVASVDGLGGRSGPCFCWFWLGKILERTRTK